MTRVITIGSSGRNYSSLAAFEADIGAGLPNGPQADGQPWDVQVYNDAGAALTISAGITFNPTTSATNTLTIRAASGTGAGGAPNDHTTRGNSVALRYDATKGAAFAYTGTWSEMISVATGYLRFQNLQFTGGEGAILLGGATAQNLAHQNCIWEQADTGGNDVAVQVYANVAFENCLIYRRAAQSLYTGSDGTVTFTNCTLHCFATSGTRVAIAFGPGHTVNLHNCAVFGFSAVSSGTGTLGGDYNATDLASGLPGANSDHALTLSSQFENTSYTTRDFRLKTGANLIDAGGGTYTSTDILGTTRSTPDIGAYEVPSAGGSPQTITASALAVTATFGTASVQASATVTASALSITPAFGTAGITAGGTIAATALPVTVSFGTPSVQPGAVTLSPAALAVTPTFGTATLGSAIAASALSVPVTFGTPSVSATITLSPSALAINPVFGTPTDTFSRFLLADGASYLLLADGASRLILSDTASVQASALAVTVAFGTPTVTAGAVTVSAPALAATSAFGTPSVTVGAVTIPAPALSVAPTFGTAGVSAGGVITVGALAVTATFGTPSAQPGPVTLTPAALAASVAFGTPTVSADGSIAASALAVTAAFGTASVTQGTATVRPSALSVPVAFGTPSVQAGPVTITAPSLAVGVTFGATGLSSGGVITVPPMAVMPTFGTVTTTTVVTVPMSALAAGVAFGTPTIQVGPVTITAPTLAVTATFAAPTVIATGSIMRTATALAVSVAFPAVRVSIVNARRRFPVPARRRTFVVH